MEASDSVVFYDAHLGFAGAVIPLPDPIKKVADELNGMPYSLSKAVELLQKAANKLVDDKRFAEAKIEIKPKGDNHYYVSDMNWICLWLAHKPGLPTHSFRVICYKTMDEIN